VVLFSRSVEPCEGGGFFDHVVSMFNWTSSLFMCFNAREISIILFYFLSCCIKILATNKTFIYNFHVLLNSAANFLVLLVFANDTPKLALDQRGICKSNF